jgi:hypothetical protein
VFSAEGGASGACAGIARSRPEASMRLRDGALLLEAIGWRPGVAGLN